MFKLPIGVKMTVIIAVLFILSIVFTEVYLESEMNEKVHIKLNEEVNIILTSLNYSVTELFEQNDSRQITDVIRKIASYEIVESIKIYDMNQFVIYSNINQDVGKIESKSVVSNIIERKLSIQIDSDVREGRYEAAQPIRGGDREVFDAVLYIKLDVDQVREYYDSVASRIISYFQYVLIGFAVLVIFAEYLMVNKPIKRIIEATNQISKDNYDFQVEEEGSKEFLILANRFNAMTASVKKKNFDLTKAKIEAEEAGNAKMQFLARMSHEIRTPLNSIIGFTEILEEKESNQDKKLMMSKVKNSSNHLLNLVNDILDYSKIEIDEIELENEVFYTLDQLKTIKGMYDTHEKRDKIEFTVNVSQRVPKILVGDSFRIRQIVINLITNAFKYTEEGFIRVFVDYKEGDLLISVEDSGKGIEESKQTMIFQPFMQLEDSMIRKSGGVGMGLSISSKIAKLMSGDITVHSTPGIGSRFDVRLKLREPRQDEYDRPLPDNQSIMDNEQLMDEDKVRIIKELPKKLAAFERTKKQNDIIKMSDALKDLKREVGTLGIVELFEEITKLESMISKKHLDKQSVNDAVNNLKKLINDLLKEITMKEDERIFRKPVFSILVAEDVMDNQLLMKKILEPFDAEIDYAENGVIAIEKLKNKRYDLLLLDMRMPVMGGMGVLEWIKETSKLDDLYIIATTANVSRQDLDNYLNSGCDDYVPKPIKKSVLRKKIEYEINRKAFHVDD